MPTPDWLSPDDARFIIKGLSINIASRDARHVPSVARGLACRFSDSGAQLIVVLCRSQSRAVLADIERTGYVAVVMTEPSSHRTLQIKGIDGAITEAGADDLPLIEASRQNFGADILSLGFPLEINDRLYHYTPEDLCRVVFTPTDVYQQTPGPDAGVRIGPTGTTPPTGATL